MKFRFKKNIVAFGKDNREGEIIEVDSNHADTIFCLSNGWLERYDARSYFDKENKNTNKEESSKMNPFDYLIEDIFNSSDFVDFCYINNRKTKCIASEITNDASYTAFGMMRVYSFFLGSR